MFKTLAVIFMATCLVSTPALATLCHKDKAPVTRSLKRGNDQNQNVNVTVVQKNVGNRRPSNSGWGHGPSGYGSYDPFAQGVIGGIVGGVIGGWFAPPPPVVVVQAAPPPVVVVRSPTAWSPDWYDYCNGKYRSFDAKTGYFTGYDGAQHFCS